MRIFAGKHKNGLYSFKIVSKNNSFESPKDFYKLSFTKPYYKEKHQALKDAQKVYNKYWFLVTANFNEYDENILNSDVMEEQIYAHYFESYKALNQELQSLDLQDPENRNYLFGKLTALKKEIEFFIQFIRPHKTKLQGEDFEKFIKGIENCQNRYFQKEKEKYEENPELFTPQAPEEGGGEGGGLEGLLGSYKNRIITSSKINLDEYEILETIAEEIIKSLSDNFHFVIKEKELKIIIKEDSKEILIIGISDNFIINQIHPGKDNLLKYHDIYFYEKYVKPVLEKLHLYEYKENKILLVKSLPNIPSVKEISHSISYFDNNDKKTKETVLKINPEKTWHFTI